MRKLIACALVVVLAVTWVGPAAYAQGVAVGPPGLTQVEEILYGRSQEGALIPRLERVEMDVFGRLNSDSAILVRVQRLTNLLTGVEGDLSLTMKLNVIEWATFQQVHEKLSISRRLDQLESALYGQTRSNEGLGQRLDDLMRMMWPGGRVYVSETVVPKATLVRIELLTELNSETSKPGDVLRYQVVDDVVIDHQVVIPAGTQGEGSILAVDSAGRLGQDGLVRVDFGTVRAIDATSVPLQIAEEATEQNKSIELAAGASIAGVVLLGPIGLAAGYFVRGRPHVVPVGTKFYVEVSRDTQVNALSLVPTTGN